MSRKVREWLPAEALEGGAVPALVEGAVGAWASKWFSRAQPRAGSFAVRAGKADVRAGGWRLAGKVGAALSAAQVLRVAGLATNAQPERLVLSETDRDIIGRLAAEIVADLARTIGTALGLDPAGAGEADPLSDPFGGGGGLQFVIGDTGGEPLADIAIPAAALIAFRKAGIPESRRRLAPLAPTAAAVEAMQVRVSARLGAATLPLGELAGLAAGDVLVLDRSVEDGAELSLGTHARPFARGEIVSGGRGFSLRLLPQQKEL